VVEPSGPLVPISRPVLGAAERAAVDRVLASGSLIQGAEVAAFETEFGDGVEHRECVALASGTAALHLGLMAAGIKPGDEVVVPAFTFAATANAVVQVGAVPVFADIDPRTYCLDPAAVETALTPRTAAVIAVHLYGHPADMEALRLLADRHGLLLMEDAAQAQGACLRGRPAGALADVAAFSFYPSKLMTTGEGGMLVCADPAVATTARTLRNQGVGAEPLIGLNARMTEMAAAIGRVQLTRAPEFLARRRDNAAIWDLALGPDLTPYRAEGTEHGQSVYTIRHADRDAARSRLEDEGVETRVYYDTPLHLTPQYIRPDRAPLPASEAAARAVLSVPVGPHLDQSAVERVRQALARL